MDHKIIINESLKYYENSLIKYGDTPKGVNWKDKDSQNLRFSILSRIGDLDKKSLHDVGCGTASFRDFLENHYPECNYIGSDISDLMIKAAKKRLKADKSLYKGDILTESCDWMQADYVINSGIFTVRQEASEEDWREFVYLMIDRMFELATIGIGFNMMSNHVDYKDQHLYYASPQDILEYCLKNLSRKVSIHHDYDLYEFTTFVYK